MRIIQTGRSAIYRKTCPAIMFATIATVACSDSTSPRDTTFDNPTGTFQASMVAVVGVGEGGMSITPKSIPEGYFAADIKVRIRKARANATYAARIHRLVTAFSDRGTPEGNQA